MAAPMRSSCARLHVNVKCIFGNFRLASKAPANQSLSKYIGPLRYSTSNSTSSKSRSTRSKWIIGLGVVTATVVGVKLIASPKTSLPVESNGIPDIRPSRQIRIPEDSSGMKLTLFQYQTCPFCCKVRAMLDYYGISYDVVEVNSVLRSEIKWSPYKKVPILVYNAEGAEESTQLNDSSVTMSILYSHLLDKNSPISHLKSFYPPCEVFDERKGKNVKDFENKYFIMYQEDASDGHTSDQQKEERKWRKWTDKTLVHVLSPNVYRTPTEAVQTFKYFSEVGNWENVFSAPMRVFVIYTGATAMYFLGKLLKKRYNLQEDVRQSLYQECDIWVRAIGKERKFMGGSKPNLADLSVYGVLSSIEGCEAFKDAVENTNIKAWYSRMQKSVTAHEGLNAIVQPTPASQPVQKQEKSQSRWFW